MIVITGPTGQIGSQLLARLMQGEEPIRVIARDPAKLPPDARGCVEIVQGSYEEPETVARAFEGADCVFWLISGDPAAESAQAAFVDRSRPTAEAVRQCGVKHVVTVSALGRDWPGEAGHATASIRMDDMFAATGASLRALACPSLMDNTLRQLGQIRDHGVFYGAGPAAFRTPYLATCDIAAAAAELLQDRSWSGAATLPLLGPQDISFDDQARIMSQVLGKPVAFREISLEDLRSMMTGQGASQGMTQAMIDMITAKIEGLDLMIPRSPQNTTPTSFRTWCEMVLKPAIEREAAAS